MSDNIEKCLDCGNNFLLDLKTYSSKCKNCTKLTGTKTYSHTNLKKEEIKLTELSPEQLLVLKAQLDALSNKEEQAMEQINKQEKKKSKE